MRPELYGALYGLFSNLPGSFSIIQLLDVSGQQHLIHSMSGSCNRWTDFNCNVAAISFFCAREFNRGAGPVPAAGRSLVFSNQKEERE